jgi:translation machinery-associated protein 16
VDRIDHIYEAVQDMPDALSDEELAEFVKKYVLLAITTLCSRLTPISYINRDTPEIEQLQSERRKGRPPSKREEALKERVQAEDREFTTGLWMPDLSDSYVMTTLKAWNRDWSGLSAMKFIRFKKNGEKLASSFPPNRMS